MELYPFLYSKFLQNSTLIRNWFEEKFKTYPAIFYNSVDIRHSNYKVGVVDTNCFPAGFNNLSKISQSKATKEVNGFLEQFPNSKKILIISENFNRNIRYLENIYVLKAIIENTNREVVIGSFLNENKLDIDISNGKKVTIFNLKRKNNNIITSSSFVSDIIISNNDFTSYPDISLSDLTQDIVPNPLLGWFNRSKVNYFNTYSKLTEEFANILQFDPWLISCIHSSYKNFNIKEKSSLDSVALKIDNLLNVIRKKYEEYNILDKPYLYIKFDKGTYGLGIITIFSSEEVLNLNKKQRNRISYTKGNNKINEIIIQEGVITSDLVTNVMSEPLIYLVNGKVVGNLFRLNSKKDKISNLNSSGMSFADLENLSDNQLSIGGDKKEVIYIYSIIAQLAALASSIEYSNML